MLKRLVILSLSFIFSCVFAGGPEAPVRGYFDGFYIGGSAGPQYVAFKRRVAAVRVDSGFPFGRFSGGASIKLFWVGGPYLGYGGQMGQFYLGANLNETFEKAAIGADMVQVDDPFGSSRSVTLVTRLSSSLALNLKAGYLLTPMTMVYLQIGGVYLSSAGFSSVAKESFVTSTIADEVSEKIFGYRVGIGIEQGVGHNLSVSLAYSYTGYSWLGRTTSILGGDFVSDIHVRPYTSQVVLGLTYYFNFM